MRFSFRQSITARHLRAHWLRGLLLQPAHHLAQPSPLASGRLTDTTAEQLKIAHASSKQLPIAPHANQFQLRKQQRARSRACGKAGNGCQDSVTVFTPRTRALCDCLSLRAKPAWMAYT